MLVNSLEQQYNNKLLEIKDKQLTVQIYKSRRVTEPDMAFQAVDPRNHDYLLYADETLPKVMAWCEKQGFVYKYLPNSGNQYL